MNYRLNTSKGENDRAGSLVAAKGLWKFLRDEKKIIALSFAAIMINSLVNLFGPFLIGHTVDNYVLAKQFRGVLNFSGLLFGMFILGFVASYLQTKLMGGMSQRVLFKLRNAIFSKLQELPVEFFNQNKAGDLISRINNDTDKLNQFFSQALMQFIGSIFMMAGSGIFLLMINFKIGAAVLLPAVPLFFMTRIMSPWIKRKNAANLKSTGDISAEIQESLNNFKVIVAFDRRDFFRKRFEESNDKNYRAAIGAGIANNFFAPIYNFASMIAQIILIVYGAYLISLGQFTLGLLISFLAYVNSFYSPLRQLAALWANFQTAMAGWDRIAAILAMQSNLTKVPAAENVAISGCSALSFKDVSFAYPEGVEILHKINFTLEKGKTYALVGPTGGGKTTTASLMARIFDPTKGTIFLDCRDIRSYDAAERTKKIGFILQEPFLLHGTVKDNMIYGNEKYAGYSVEQMEQVIKEAKLEKLLTWFDKGLETMIETGGETISLGQKQLIAFVRAILRKPEILILDEATANIDTVTEQLLEEVLSKLPEETTKVIIAHRLNTIESADEIFFVNNGEITLAGSMEQAVDMLLNDKRKS